MSTVHTPNSAAIADRLIALSRLQVAEEQRRREYLFGVDEEPRLVRLHPVAGERNDDHAPRVPVA
jgi:hypothetical protein